MNPTLEQQIADTRRRFETQAPSPLQAYAMQANREAFADLAQHVLESTIPSREQSLVLTALEEAKFWANQAIMQHGVRDAEVTE